MVAKVFSPTTIGADASGILHQMHISVAPNPSLSNTPGRYIPTNEFKRENTHLIAERSGPSAFVPLAWAQHELLRTLVHETRMSTSSSSSIRSLIPQIAHQLALYAYIAARVEPKMYRIYTLVHATLVTKGFAEDGDIFSHICRSMWGRAQYAVRHQEDSRAWGKLTGDASWASHVARQYPEYRVSVTQRRHLQNLSQVAFDHRTEIDRAEIQRRAAGG